MIPLRGIENREAPMRDKLRKRKMNMYIYNKKKKKRKEKR